MAFDCPNSTMNRLFQDMQGLVCVAYLCFQFYRAEVSCYLGIFYKLNIFQSHIYLTQYHTLVIHLLQSLLTTALTLSTLPSHFSNWTLALICASKSNNPGEETNLCHHLEFICIETSFLHHQAYNSLM